MRNLGVWIEIGGLQTYVGCIIGENEEDARLSYAEEYLSGNIARPISIHLPLSENAFSVDDTRNFFEGLLPEGFTRRCVAGLLHTDANDYLTLLAGLGNECLGAIRITDENNEVVNADYQKLQELLESRVTAVFSVSDFYAFEFMRFLQGKNIKTPKDIQIIGFDDNMASRESTEMLAYQNS